MFSTRRIGVLHSKVTVAEGSSVIVGFPAAAGVFPANGVKKPTARQL
jgi:hypothetical protein